MKQLQTGQFFGQTNKTILFDGITLTETEYTQDKVDWHYHENAYFTFILKGNMVEVNKKEKYHCGEGSLLFHNWQEPHYNSKPAGFTMGFHIELEKKWAEQFSFDMGSLLGNFKIVNPDITLCILQVYLETKTVDDLSAMSIQSNLLRLMALMVHNDQLEIKVKPSWVGQLKEILHDTFCENISLENLSEKLGIHPVHLSRDFPKYFQCGLGKYIRMLRVEKSMMHLINRQMPLSEIAYDCGFADQSHFIKCFREVNDMNPSAYRRLL
jgi:AraC family transcriptional regulator